MRKKQTKRARPRIKKYHENMIIYLVLHLRGFLFNKNDYICMNIVNKICKIYCNSLKTTKGCFNDKNKMRIF